MPDDIHFKSLEERIVHMANVKASVGELKMISTAGHLQQTIVIVGRLSEDQRVQAGRCC